MANLPDRLLAGLSKKAAAPAPAANPNPAPSPSTLAPSSTTTAHPEKVTHAVSKLSAAGLGSVSSSASSSSSHHSSNTKWIIIGATVGGVVLIAVLLVSWIFYRRYKKKRAYAMVSRGVDMTGTPAWQVTPPERDQSAPRPLFLSKGMAAARQQGNDGREPYRGRGMSVNGGLGSHPSGGRARSQSATPSIGGRNRMSMGGEEMFSQDKEMDLSSGMMEQGRKIGESNFERGYDEVDTGYDAALMHGDRRSAGA